MLRRAWMVIATLWAILMSWLIFREDPPNTAFAVMVVAYGPLALPWVLRLFLSYVITGSVQGRAPKKPLPGRI